MSIEEEILGQMAGSVELEHALDELSHQIAGEIKDLTPEFGDLPPKRGEPPHGEAGDAKDAIKVERVPGALDTRRVISRDYKAVWIELGTRHMPEYAPFAKVAAMHGGTGPTIDEGVQHAQHKLRHELETLAKLRAGYAGTMHEAIAKAQSIAEQKRAVDQARLNRSAAFKAARGGRRGRSR